jgi:hypothetical protein
MSTLDKVTAVRNICARITEEEARIDSLKNLGANTMPIEILDILLLGKSKDVVLRELIAACRLQIDAFEDELYTFLNY